MSERQPHYETDNQPEVDAKEIEKASQKAAEKHRNSAEKAAESDLRNSLEAIQERVEKAARSKAEVDAEIHNESAASETPLQLGGQFKSNAYKQQLRHVQRREKTAERAFSKLIHKPAIEEISNIAESTIARPSGLLFSGLFSLVSSLTILWISRHYGYEYNFLVGLASLAGGFAAGLLLEAIWRGFKRS